MNREPATGWNPSPIRIPKRWARRIHPDHHRPSTQSIVLGPDDWERWSENWPHDPTFQLLAWVSGRRLDVLPAEVSSHLARVEALDMAARRRYLGLLRAAAERLPVSLREVVMEQLQKPIARFALHPQEIAWEQQGIEKGIEKGLEKGLQKGIERGLRRGRREGVLKGITEVAVDVLGQETVDAVIASTPASQRAERLKALVRARLQG